MRLDGPVEDGGLFQFPLEPAGPALGDFGLEWDRGAGPGALSAAVIFGALRAVRRC